jgi:outer membrane protein OmpA-like peptidoglycan-associated protein
MTFRTRTPAAATLLASLLAAGAVGTVVPAHGAATASPGAEDSPGSGASPDPDTAADDTRTVTTSAGVEVTTYGTAPVHPYQKGLGPPAYFAVHAVQRVESVTVVYLSVGFTEGDADDFSPVALSDHAGPEARFIAGGGLTSILVVDPAGGEVLSTLPAGDGRRVNPATSGGQAFPTRPGVMHALYAVLPPLDAGVEAVDVQLGYGSVISDVPVGDGLLTPVAEEEAVPLGTGWPAIDEDLLTEPVDPDASRHPLSSVTEAIDGSRVTTETGEQVTIDVAADVLFAFDSAKLSPEAVARVREVAAEIVARAAPGRLTVVGHTDSEASEAYNDDLSQRRAAAVAAVLEPALAGGPDLDLAVEGRGEREPVADNSTEEGRQANRRVSITFTIDASQGEAGR